MMPEFKADLHCHSTCSDGTLTPVELVNLAHSLGLSGLSITDHDTIEAYKTAIPEAKRLGIRLGTGVELSCEFQGISVHVLGYDFSLENWEIQELCTRHHKRRTDRNRAILEKLKHYKMPVEEKELLEKAGTTHRTLGRPHIAALMVEKGYVSDIRAAFNLYLAEGKRCYVQGEPFQVSEAIEILHQAGGKAFLAHPQLLPKNFSLKAIFQLPFDGLECYYSRFQRDVAEHWVKIAAERKLLISGGSDFHGSVKPEVVLGCSFVNETVFNAIFSHPVA
jgi:predicted metal-dependent phosphoesterase TrpH